MGGFSQYTQPAEETSSRRLILIAVAGVAVVVGALAFLFRDHKKPAAHSGPPPYAANLSISGVHFSRAENFVGGAVTYIEGKIANNGDQTVTAIDAEVIFRNDLGEVVDKQTQPLAVEAALLGNSDWVSLGARPLLPGRVANFRLTFEHISADWNQGYPEIAFVTVTTR
jgi:hypothetical protein